MIDEVEAETSLWPLAAMFKRACQRCRTVAETERVLGYDESYVLYSQIAEEFNGLYLWAWQEMWVTPEV